MPLCEPLGLSWRTRHGVLAIVDAPEPNDGQALLLADGMEVLVGVLGNVVSGLGEEKH